ncbi:helix-turn-helix domain-containing protein [Roseibacterium sp. KMU-115]|uniref:Helix-turn-helix domain-containing protein n=1 Tax=Roseicyclus persicicus TaxID=2650661 RepID=A0A7X6GWB2_9RHOB|nr:helix-turn-helix domain-containing protein [Roseibacterium persicicum]
MPKLRTTVQAAQYLGVSPKWLERDRMNGATVPFIRVGRHVRYSETDLAAFLSANREGVAA